MSGRFQIILNFSFGDRYVPNYFNNLTLLCFICSKLLKLVVKPFYDLLKLVSDRFQTILRLNVVFQRFQFILRFSFGSNDET